MLTAKHYNCKPVFKVRALMTEQTQTTATGMAALRQAEEQAKAPLEGELITGQDTTTQPPAEGGEPTPAQEPQGNGDEYVAPNTEELQQQNQQSGDQAAPAAQTDAAQASEEAALFDTTPALVEKGEMVSPKGDAASNVMLARIAKHMVHLKGDKGFGSDKERWEEQASFMECVGRSLGLSYAEHVLITDTLIQHIRDNLKLFTSGECFRFMHDLCLKYPQNSPVKYPRENAERYQAYISYLTNIAQNYATRHRLKTGHDLGHTIKDMNNVGKQNVTKYFNQLTNN